MNMHIKKYLFFLMLLSVTLFGLAYIYTQRNSPSSGVVYITETDINDASRHDTNGYVIDKPGTYILENNTNWSVNIPDSFAITIATNNVTLNGKDHSITQTDPSGKHALGIQVKESCKDIKIENIKFHALSGGGIWFRGDNVNLTVKNCKFTNCGYFGMTQLDTKNLPKNIPTAFTQSILFDGGYGRPIKDAQVIDCVFAECGILRSTPSIYESHCGAILAYHATDITIKGCTIDGCIGRNTSYALSLMDITNALIDDVFITDIFSSGKAEGIFTHDVDGQVKNTLPTAIVSHVPAYRFEDMLDNHMNYKEDVEIDPTYRIEANHLKRVIPQHKEHIQTLFDEHKWREFRTLGRLVCHHADKRSQTTAMYGTWVELFCERILDVKVRVVGAFANLYENGSIPLPAHRDQYKKWIIGLSFGGTRTLEFVPDDPEAAMVPFLMESGDVFIFAPDVNNRYMHRMQEEPDSKERRINLTYFLDILPGQDPNKLLKSPKLDNDSIPTFEEAIARYNQEMLAKK